MPILSDLYRYPMKSTQGENLLASLVFPAGLPWDRAFMVADLAGEMITGRTHPALVQVLARVTDDVLHLSLPQRSTLALPLHLFSRPVLAAVWGTSFTAWGGACVVDELLTAFLGKPAQLLFCGEQQQRRVKAAPDVSLGFADGYPLLLIGQASLDDLNQRLAQPVTMANFRPNLVVSAAAAFAEDSWRRIRIGEVTFRIAKPCERCVFTTVDPISGIKNPQQEPLRTLASYRKTPAGVLFGQNVIAENSGEIAQGMEVEILETV